MSTTDSIIKFEPLPMKHRVLADKDANRYCIRYVSGEEREIKADTAYEALRKGGQGDVIKIERVFSLAGNMIDKSRLAEEAIVTFSKDATGNSASNESLHDRIRRRRNPIISADELAELMDSLKSETEAVLTSEEININSTPMPVAASSETDTASAVVPPPMPAPDTSAIQAEMTSPIGVEVHGDGFDEIIPTPAKPPVAHKHADAKEAAHAAAPTPELPPERELSPEEVEKLLGGK